jgi:uncharacterized protein (TIGR03435 family)
MKSLACAIGALALCGAAFAQSAAPAPAFEIADVHVSPLGTKESGLYLHANRMEMHGATMLRLIATAYGIADDKIFGGPNWLDSNRFEVIAKAGTAVNIETLQPMLQALLADRFQLKVHNEDKPEPILALVPGKRVQLKESASPGDPDCKRTNEEGYIVYTCQHVSLASLAERLPGVAPNYFNHPVVDKTGLTGVYDLKLKWSGRGQLGAGDSDHPAVSLFDYFEKQLGIKVEPQTRPSPGLVIDRVNREPTPNQPGIAAKLPPPVTEFEVAEVRPSKPDTPIRFSMKNGRLELFGLTMKDLITVAFSLDDYMIAGGEKWLDSDRFDVIAKAAPNTTNATLEAMLRTLLEQRFHLTTHAEQQPVPVYALTAPKGKTKLKETTGEDHAGCTRTPKDGAFTYSCRNTTMAQFADKLASVPGASGYLDRPMVDLTGLTGSYDFDVTWSPPARVYGRGGRGGDSDAQSSGGAAIASAPTGGLTIFEAIDKQLGLKLAVEKHPMPVIVIDRVDRTPSDN